MAYLPEVFTMEPLTRMQTDSPTGMERSSERMIYKFMTSRDMAKVGCQDCAGCSDCCKGMGTSVLLDPYDMMELKRGLGSSFEELMQDKIQLHVEDGLILPSLAMSGREESCTFLDEKGRCTVHGFRPGLCRLFPLGRDYSAGHLQYFLLEDACSKQNRSKVKIEKWLDVPDLSQHEKFLTEWHFFLGRMRQRMEDGDDSTRQRLAMQLLVCFYQQDFQKETFYETVRQRMEQIDNH